MPIVRSPRRSATASAIAVVAGAAAVLALSGCSEEKGSAASGTATSGNVRTAPSEVDSRKVGGAGKAVALGLYESLVVSPDGTYGAFLSDTEKPRLEGVNPLTRLGALSVAKLDAGAGARQLATGVSNLPGGYAFSGDSKYLLFVAGYSPASREGTLNLLPLSDLKAAPAVLGKAVSFFALSPDSRWIAVVDGGVLKVGPLGSASLTDVSGEVSSAEFAGDGSGLVFQRRVTAGSGLFHVSSSKWTEQHKLADGVNNYAFAADGKHVAYAMKSASVPNSQELFVAEVPKAKSVRVAVAVGPFAFSPDGKLLARVESTRFDNKARMVLGQLFVGASDGARAHKLSDKATDRSGAFTFAPDSKAIAWWEPPTRKIGPTDAWQLGVATLPEGKPHIAGDQVPNYRWGADGSVLAYVTHVFKPVYTVDLYQYRPGEDGPKKVHAGVFGYAFAPKNAGLFFRSGCTDLPKGCDLFESNPAQPDEQPKVLLEKIFDFRASEDGGRLLYTYARVERGDYYDAAVLNLKTSARKTLDQKILWPPYFLAKDGSKAGYVIGDKSKAGVYVATDLP